MTVRRTLLIFVVLAALLGAAQWWLQWYGQRRLQQVVSKLRPWVEVSVGHARFWLWGEVALRDIRLRPRAMYAAQYGLPLDYTATVDSLRLHGLRPAWNGGLRLEAAALDLHGVHLPLPDWGWSVTVARGADGRRLHAPTLRELGVTSLALDVAMRLRWPYGWSRPQVEAVSAVPDLGGVHLRCDLDTGAARLGAPDQLILRACGLRYDDAGLVSRFERRMARDNDVAQSALRDAVVRQLRLDARRTRWPPLNTAAVEAFVRTPAALELRIRPPHPLPLGMIPRAVWPGLPAYLGLTASVPSAAGF